VGRLTPNELFARHHWPLVDFVTGLSYIVYVYWALAFALYLLFFRRDRPGRRLLARLGWTFAAVNIVGFATYYIYPAAPPWYVAQHGLGPADLSVAASPAAAARWDALTGIPYFASFYGRAADVFGAIPSLHVAYPLLVFLYGRALRRPVFDALNIGLFMLVSFSAVYLQHHYVLDVALGAGYALAGFGVERLISAKHEVSMHRKIPRQPDHRPGEHAGDEVVKVQPPVEEVLPEGVPPQAGGGDEQVADGLPVQAPAGRPEGEVAVEQEVGDGAAQGTHGRRGHGVEPQPHRRREDAEVHRGGRQRSQLEADEDEKRLSVHEGSGADGNDVDRRCLTHLVRA
jgi:hypothetical protein